MKLKNTPKNEEKDLLGEIQKQGEQIVEYTDTLKRLQADFENYVKRTEKEKLDYTKYASHKLLLKLLIMVDDYEKAIKAIENTDDVNQLKTGLNIILTNLNKTLEEEGVKEIKAIGEKVDPYQHDVIGFIEGDNEDLVVEELQRGYKLHDKVLRPSKVRVSKKKEEKDSSIDLDGTPAVNINMEFPTSRDNFPQKVTKDQVGLKLP